MYDNFNDLLSTYVIAVCMSVGACLLLSFICWGAWSAINMVKDITR